MPYRVAFDLSNSEVGTILPSIVVAIANQTHLGNLSLVTRNRKVDVESKFLDELQQNNIPVFDYSKKEDLDQHLITNHVLFIFRISQQISDIIPLSSLLAVYGPITAKHGDIFCDNSEWIIDPNNSKTLAEQFNSRVIQPILTIVPTMGFLGDKGSAVIFVGSRTPKDLTVVRTDAMRNANIVAENQSSRFGQAKAEILPRDSDPQNSIQDVSPNVTKCRDPESEIKSTSSISPLEILKQTLDSITSRKNDKIRIKMVCNWTSSSQLLRDWSHMMEDSLAIRNIEWITDGIPDYWVVINKPPENERIIPKQTIVFRMEPYIDNIYFYNDWLTGKKKTDFLYFLDHENHRNNTEWWLGLSFPELAKPVQKTELFSAVTSSQYHMEGHRLRIDFIKFFQVNSQIPLDVFGHDNTHQFLNYKGSLPLRRKDVGILPYKYHFAAENSDIANYMTEKFFDALIGECLLFYWGCRNIAKHFDERVFIRLDLRNPEESLKIVETAIMSNEWEKRLPIIRKEKRRIMQLMNPFIRISTLLHVKNLKFIQVCNSTSIPQSIPGLHVDHFLPSRMEIFPKLVRNYTKAKISLGQIVQLARHFTLWTSCSAENKPFLIFEGIPFPNFLDYFSEMWSHVEHSDVKWDMIALQWTENDSKNGSNITPSRDAVLNSLDSCFIDLSKRANLTDLINGKVGIAYVLHPQAAGRLVSFVNDYGFLNCLDEMLLSIPLLMQNWRAWITSRNLMIPEKNENASEMCHIFHKNQQGQWNTEIPPFVWPPIPNAEIQLVPESQIKFE